MTQDSLFVGLDLGTQSVKVSVVDRHGVVVAAASAPLVSDRRGGRHEQDPHSWVARSRDALSEALASLPVSEVARIAGIAICATSGTITTVDASGAPLTTGIMYDDGRAGGLSDEVTAADPARWARLGYRIQPTWALPKILWLVRAGAIVLGATIAHQPDVVAAAIVGRKVATDWSHSLKSGYDLLALDWPAAALDTLGISPAVLPTVVAPGTVLGESSVAWGETGLPPGTPVFAGMTDGCAAQLGAGTLALGDWHTVIGTTLVVKGVSDRIVIDDTGAVYSHRAPHDGLWFPGGASSAGAGAISTFLPGVDLVATTRQIEEEIGRIDSIPVCYPLAGRGERFPLVRPDAAGFASLGGTDVALGELDPAPRLAAIMLGVAGVERLAVETMEAAGVPVDGTFSSSGGGVRNRWWTQLRADLLGRSITIPVAAEGSIGMAILACWASGAVEGSDLQGTGLHGAGLQGSGLPAPRLQARSAGPGAPGGSLSLPATATAMSRVGSIVEPDDRRRDELEHYYGSFRSELVSRGWISA